MKIFEEARKSNWKTCSYGLGRMGTRLGRKLLEWLKLEPDFYCDKNSEVLERYPVTKDKKIFLDDLMKIKDDVLVLVFIGVEHSNNVKQELEKNKYLHVLTCQQLINDDEIIREYFGIGQLLYYHEEEKHIDKKKKLTNKKTGKVAIYTCITNEYDQLNQPLCIEENCDYFFITDSKSAGQLLPSSVYQRIDIEKVVPREVVSPKDQNRYCKSHGYEIFKEYDYSIYLDGSIQIVKPILPLIERIGEVGVAFHKHPYAEDLYAEALSLSIRSRITKKEADETIKWFWNSGMPRFYGMVECGVILCNHHSPIAGRLLDNWFENYFNGAAKRDQMYMAFSLWELGIPVSEVRVLPGNLRTNGYFRLMAEHTGYQR